MPRAARSFALRSFAAFSFGVAGFEFGNDASTAVG
jgi:hypothetical protein